MPVSNGLTANSEPDTGRKVALVLDPHFGSQVESIGRIPIWVVSSPVNDAAATEARTHGTPVTVLRPAPSETPRETLRRALSNIEDHHGQHTAAPYEVLILYGVEPSLISSEWVKDFGFKSVASEKGPIVLSKA